MTCILPPQSSAMLTSHAITARLEETLRRETSEDDFSALPSQYLEVSKVLLEM